jgi:hypothetical protein
VSVAFQNLAGPPITANYVATNAEIKPSLGRDLAAGPAATVSIPLIPANTMFGARVSELDLRFTKNVNVGVVRLTASVDLYNAL